MSEIDGARGVPVSAILCQFCGAEIMDGEKHRTWCPVIGPARMADTLADHPDHPDFQEQWR